MKNIETGVDKLVKIIEDQKKVSLDEAAKKLGVSKVLVQEWADFLEQDGLISIEYSLSKVYLVERKLSKAEVEKKTKEYTNRKESFIRKVETTLQTMDKDVQGIEKIKDEFKKLKKDIGGEIETVKKDFHELEYYENLKENIDKDIEKQKKEYSELMETSHREIKNEERRYRELIAQIDQERLKVTKDKKAIKTMEDQEQLVEQKIAELNNLLTDIRVNMKREEHNIEITENNIQKVESFVDQVGHRLKTKKHEAILPLIKLSQEHSNKIFNLQETIIEKLKTRKKEFDSYKGQKQAVYKDLKKFFDKKEKAEKLLKSIEQKKEQVAKEYQDLVKQAEAFNAINKSSTVKKQMNELEKHYQKIETHRSGLREELKKLTDLIKG